MATANRSDKLTYIMKLDNGFYMSSTGGGNNPPWRGQIKNFPVSQIKYIKYNEYLIFISEADFVSLLAVEWCKGGH